MILNYIYNIFIFLYLSFPHIKHFSFISYYFSTSLSLKSPNVSIIIPATIFTIITTRIKLENVSQTNLPVEYIALSASSLLSVIHPLAPPLAYKLKYY